MNLSESEEKFLLRLEKNVKRAYVAYISAGISLCAAVVCLIIGMLQDREELNLTALICGLIGVSLFSVTRAYQKMFIILSKMKQTIRDLEVSK
jgi:hypothetical protein